MSDPILEPGAALDRLAQWKGRIDQLAADTRTMSDRLRQLRVTATDDDRMVEVSVDAQGALADLKLSARIHQVDADTVARTIMSTVRQARHQVADRTQEIISETVGPDSTAGQAIATRVGERLRQAEDGDRP